MLDLIDGVGYVHTAADADADHEAVPVPEQEANEVNHRCDFCFADNPGWVVPARDFTVVAGHNSRGDWAACDHCVRLVERNQWSTLVKYVLDTWEDRRGEPAPYEAVHGLPPLYRKLRKNLTGAPRPIR